MIEQNVFNSVKYIVLSVSTVCNLKCKNCITFTPYHRNPQFFPVSEMKSDIVRFFHIFGQPLERVDLGGGEPLLHPQITELVQFLLEYQGKWFSQMRILTNGSLKIPESLLSILSGRDAFFLLDDYGPELSPEVKNNEALLQAKNIAYRVNTYHGTQQYFGGWIDFGNLEFKNHTDEQLEYMRLHCFDIYSESDVSKRQPCDHLHIKNGKICYCDMQQVGASHIPVRDGDFIDLRSAETDQQLHERLKSFKTELIETCKYCNGFMRARQSTDETDTHKEVRVPAGIQLTPQEIQQSSLDCH